MSKLIYKVKTYDLKAMDVDIERRKVKVAIASFGNLDRDNDIITEGAATKTLMEHGPQGMNEIWHLTDHTPSLKSALSKFEEMGVTDGKLWGVSSYRDTFLWREVAWPLYEKGDITQHSIGFSIVNQKRYDSHNEITEIRLYEGSAVLWGANPETPVLEVSKNLGITKESDDVPMRLERVIKALKRDDIDGDVKSLLIIEMRQLQSEFAILQEKSTLPPEQHKAASEKTFDWDAVLKYINR